MNNDDTLINNLDPSTADYIQAKKISSETLELIKLKVDDFNQRARKKGKPPLSYEDAFHIFYLSLLTGFTCEYCGQKMYVHAPKITGLAFSFDHKIPLSKGGSNDPSNISVVHTRCNILKMDMNADDFKEILKEKGTEWARTEYLEKKGISAKLKFELNEICETCEYLSDVKGCLLGGIEKIRYSITDSSICGDYEERGGSHGNY
ncbi:MAG: HNH endonuclease signature motif containing protein [Candidatus Parvarchaeota archaeon]